MAGRWRNDEERSFWVAFSYVGGFGPNRFKQVIDHFGSAQKAWLAADSRWRRFRDDKISQNFLSRRKAIIPGRLINQLVNNYQPPIWPIIKTDRYYPKSLAVVDRSPFVLYARGKPVAGLISGDLRPWSDFWSSLPLAIVGTRKMTSYGYQVGRRLAGELANGGLIIVSGLAKGIDTTAHWSALGVGGRTVAVLGGGVDVIYPAQNYRLYQEIVSSGVVFSEFPPGTKPLPGYFPARNRIISGLSLGVLVVEGGFKSGSLITASLAAEQGREVFAVPGNITSQLSSGTNYLIKSGAIPVTEANDILTEFGLAALKEQDDLGLDHEEELILNLVSGQGLTIDEISSRLKIEVGKVTALLTKLEIKGLASNLGFGRWGRG